MTGREMCFRQGKAYVYRPVSDPNVIRIEWPNGTVDERRGGETARTRRWPDGTTETMPTTEPLAFPEWPKRREADRLSAEASRCPA